jgi:hypothetical protein
MAIQLYAKKQGTEEWVSLDLHPADPMKLNLSVQNIIDPTATTSVYSKTFKVPHTSVNGPYFKGVFNVNSVDFDAAAKADAYILDNGIFFQNGNITLNAIYNNDRDNSVEYEITFYGATSDFGTKIGGGFLNEINLNEYNHTKDSGNIIASWTGGLFNGDVTYGLIEWGYTYTKDNQPALPTLSANFTNTAPAQGSFTNPAYPLKWTQWKPQIRAKALWDKIFEEAGYTYDSAFLDSTLFKNMYIISENVSGAELDNSNNFSADNTNVYTTVVANNFKWEAPHEITDPGGNYNASTSYYTAPAAGNYQFKIATPTITVMAGGLHVDRHLGWEATLVDVNTGAILSTLTGQWDIPAYDNEVYLDPTYYPNGFFAMLYGTLTTNQAVKVMFRTFTVPGGGPIYSGSTNIQFFTQSFECIDSPNIMSFSAIMPANIRKIDFMKSIINRFRLVFVPSKFQANHFEITPWKDWILEGTSIDWTNKLDAAKDMVIKPLFYDQDRFQIYKDQEDSDYINYNYQLTYKQTIGQLNQDSNNELIKGTKEYKDQFAPTPIAPIGWKEGTGTAPNNISYIDAAKFVIPHIAKDSQTNDPTQPGKREPIQPKLRLVFYNGLQPAPVTWYLEWAGAQTQYPLMSQYSQWPVTSTTYDLNWNNSEPNWDTDVLGKAQTTVTTFNTYWKTWYDTTFDPYSRIVEANFVLDYNDIIDLKFNDYVFVKDAWYFVNSISDYIPGQTTNCRVQLIKVGNNIGITVPVITPPILPGVTVCFAQTACVSHCCTVASGASTVTIFVNGTNLSDSTTAYVDAYGTTPAPSGYYTDGTGTYFVTGVGYISSCVDGINAPCVPIDTTGCSCTQTYYQFTVQYDTNTNGCTICCGGGSTVVVYGTSPTFESNSALYLNNGLTQGAPAGFYLLPGVGANALQVGTNNGAVQQVFICSNCSCTTLYPFSTCFGASNCASCCCDNGTFTVWGDNATFGSCTHLYTNNSGTTPATNGYYKFSNSSVARVQNNDGTVTAFSTCSACTCGGDATYSITTYQEFEGFTTSTTLQKSVDGINGWTDVATATVTTSQQGASVTETWPTTVVSGSVESGVWLRSVATTTVKGDTVSNPTLSTYFALNTDQYYGGASAEAPGTVTYTVPFKVTSGDAYAFYTGGTGGTPSRLYLSGTFTEYENQGWPLNAGGNNKVVALTYNNVIATNFDTSNWGNSNFNGFTDDTGSAINCWVNSAKSYIGPTGLEIAYVGNFDRYRGYAAPGIALVDEHGEFLADRFENLGTGLTGSTFAPILLYADNTWMFIRTSKWNGVNTDASQMVILWNGPDGWTTTNNQSQVVFNGPVLAVTWDGGANFGNFYLTGTFTTAIAESTTYTCNKIFSMKANPTGTIINSTFNSGTGYNSATTPYEITYHNGKLYTAYKAGATYTYNGVSLGVQSGIQRINLDGSNDTSWTIKRITFSTATDSLFKPSPSGLGIYVKAVQYDNSINANGNIIKLDYTGLIDNSLAYNNTIVTQTGTPTFSFIVDENDNIYYHGLGITTFTPNGDAAITDPSIIQINSSGVFQHSYKLQNPSDSSRSTVYTIISTIPQWPGDNPLQLYKTDTACGSYCHVGMTPTTYYGDEATLSLSTIIYDSLTPVPFPDTNYAPTGIYSDGVVTYQVIDGIKQSTPLDTSSCSCGGSGLLEYAVNYSSTDTCTACCETAITYVYSSAVPWSDTTVLYADQAGTSFASPGYYSYTQGISLHVGSNGVVLGTSDCSACSCGEDCRSYWIRNTDTLPWSYSYTDCNGTFYYGEAAVGETLITPCTDISTFFATGFYTILRSYNC